MCIAAASGSALAQQTYPSKPVRIVVPYPPGGGNDTLARIFDQKLTEAMGQQFIVENRPGTHSTVPEPIEINTAKMSNLIEAVEPGNPKLTHIHLVQDSKW